MIHSSFYNDTHLVVKDLLKLDNAVNTSLIRLKKYLQMFNISDLLIEL